jgi:hypothetical protein
MVDVSVVVALARKFIIGIISLSTMLRTLLLASIPRTWSCYARIVITRSICVSQRKYYLMKKGT